MSIKVLLVDDHQVLRQGLRALLSNEMDFEVAGEAADAAAAIKLADRLAPDVVILDIGLPDLGGISVAKRLSANHPNLNIVALSMYMEPRIVSEMLRAGARAYVLKYSAFEDLVDAIRHVIQGRMYLSPGITKTVIDDYRRLLDDGSRSRAATLTQREREVAELLAMGQSTSDIARILSISGKTVATHRKNLMDKLNLGSIAELTQYAVKEGLIVLES